MTGQDHGKYEVRLSIIAALAENGAIGKDNDLLFYIPEDLRRFKKITLGHPVIMGRKTYESLPFKPLPGRKNIILTNQSGLSYPGSKVVHSLKDVLNECDREKENFIIGGGEIYNMFFPLVQKMYLTIIRKKVDADTYFPKLDMDSWNIIEKNDIPLHADLGFSYYYVTLEKK
ncbi:MAG: dihydrofolate reductase [Bacteroidota bacterium]